MPGNAFRFAIVSGEVIGRTQDGFSITKQIDMACKQIELKCVGVIVINKLALSFT